MQKLWNEGVAFSVDLLGEACVSDEEAAATSGAISIWSRRCRRPWPSGRANPLLETDHLGPDPADERLDQDQLALRRTDPIDFEGSLDALTGVAAPDS